jgi:hypothetical protein
LVSVDDLLVIREDPNNILEWLSEEYKYRLKDMGSPTRFLGAKTGNETVNSIEYCYI